MVKSMTGYGRGEAVLHERTITVEVRSVNNRYLDCSIKMPRLYVFAEDAIKTRVQTSISPLPSTTMTQRRRMPTWGACLLYTSLCAPERPD